MKKRTTLLARQRASVGRRFRAAAVSSVAAGLMIVAACGPKSAPATPAAAAPAATPPAAQPAADAAATRGAASAACTDAARLRARPRPPRQAQPRPVDAAVEVARRRLRHRRRPR